jgi:hypothetical protein
MGVVPSALDAASKLAILIAPEQPAEAAAMIGAIDFHSGGKFETGQTSELVAQLGEQTFEMHYRNGARLDLDRLSRLAAEVSSAVGVGATSS